MAWINGRHNILQRAMILAVGRAIGDTPVFGQERSDAFPGSGHWSRPCGAEILAACSVGGQLLDSVSESHANLLTGNYDCRKT